MNVDIGWRDRRPTLAEVELHAKAYHGGWLAWPNGSHGSHIQVVVLDVGAYGVRGCALSMRYWDGELSGIEEVHLRWRPVTREMFAAPWPRARPPDPKGIMDPDVLKELAASV